MKTYCLILLILVSNFFSQPVQQEWVRYYGGPDNTNTFTQAMAVDSNGNTYITSYTNRLNGRQDYCTIKYNSSGVQQWVAIYDGIPSSNGTNIPTAIGLDSIGNTYITGYSERTGPNSNDYCTIKYNSQGVQQWVARYSGYNGRNDAKSIGIDHSGNVYITGMSTNNSYNYEITTIKYNSIGVQQWVKRYTPDSLHDCYVNSLAVDNSGNLFIGGSGGIGYGWRIILIKYNISGVQEWLTLTYITPYSSGINKIKLDNSGNIYLTGSASYYYYRSSTFITTLKYNSSGVEQWVSFYINPYDTNGDDIGNGLAIDSYGNVIVAGRSKEAGINEDFVTIKYNSNGIQQWVQRYIRNTSEYSPPELALDVNNNIYIIGTTWNGTNYNFTTIKYNSSGVQQWLVQDPGGGKAIGLDRQKNIYVTGNNYSPAIIVTIKYNQIDGIKKIGDKIPVNHFLFQNYPNPFNPSTSIKFDLSEACFVQLNVYSINGKIINKVINTYLTGGEYQTNWKSENFSSGVYFYQLIADNKIISTKKMVLEK